MEIAVQFAKLKHNQTNPKSLPLALTVTAQMTPCLKFGWNNHHFPVNLINSKPSSEAILWIASLRQRQSIPASPMHLPVKALPIPRHYWALTAPGAGVTKVLSLISLFAIFYFAWIAIKLFELCSYLTGVTAAKLQWHLPNMNVISNK